MVRAGIGIRPEYGVIYAETGILERTGRSRLSLDRTKRGILGFLEFSRLFLGKRHLLLCGRWEMAMRGHDRLPSPPSQRRSATQFAYRILRCRTRARRDVSQSQAKLSGQAPLR